MTAATIAKSKAKTPQSNAPSLTPKAGAVATATAIANAFERVQEALHAAAMTDEPHAFSGDSDRILQQASDLAGRTAAVVLSSIEAERKAFDVAALVKAALRVPGDTASDERNAFIEEARVLLAWLTECEQVLETGAGTRMPTSAVDDDEAERISIAFNANYEIAKLAKALKAHHMREATDDWPVYNGILGRVEQLSEVVFYAARLDRSDGMAYPRNKALRQFLDGYLSLNLGDFE